MGYATRSTLELRVGDVVAHHGMRCRIVEPLRASSAHDPSLGCVWTPAVVENVAQVESEGFVPLSWLDRDDQGGRRWVIQGNDLATWYVEI